MLVVPGVAGRDLAGPVEREAHRLELLAHLLDVGVGPGRRVDALLHGRVLGRQAEGVPAHRVEDVEALRPLRAGQHVAHRVVADVPHVDAPRGVGEHLEHVVLRPAGSASARKTPRSSQTCCHLASVARKAYRDDMRCLLPQRSVNRRSTEREPEAAGSSGGAGEGAGLAPAVGAGDAQLARLGEDLVLERGGRLRVDRRVGPVGRPRAPGGTPRPSPRRRAAARSRIRTWTFSRSPALSGGWYQSVMIRPPNGSARRAA
jgi:hypothetical protein